MSSTTIETGSVETGSDKRFGQALILFGIVSALFLTLGVTTQAISIPFGLVVTLLFCVLTPAIAFVRWKGISIFEGLRLRAVSPRVLLASLLMGAGGWSIAALLVQGLAKLGVPASPVTLEMGSGMELTLILVVAAVLPGFCEECLFRGAIQGVLERRGKWFGVIFAGVLFGIFHMDPVRIVAAGYLGIIAGWLVIRTGSLWPAILSHFANNFVAISVGYFLRGTTEMPPWLFPALIGLFILSLVAFVWLTRGPEFQAKVRPSPLATVPAGLSPGVAWGCGIPGVLFGAVAIAGVALLSAMIASEKVTDDGAAPKIRSGDQVILMKPGSPVFDVDPEQHVVLKRNGNAIAREVARIDGEKLWILENGGETEIALEDIVGAVVQVIPANRSSQPDSGPDQDSDVEVKASDVNDSEGASSTPPDNAESSPTR